MKKLVPSVGLALVVFALVFAACAPKSAPVAQAPAPAPSAAPAASAPKTTSEEVAWNRIVEAAKKEGTVTLYTYSWVGDAGATLSKAFKSKYGIDVEIVTGRGAEFIERLKTEKRLGSMTADITEGSVTHLTNMKEAEILAGSGPNLPVLKQTGVWALDPLPQDKDGYILAFMPLVGAPYVNTKTVKAGEEPKTWADIAQPRWKGQMMLQDPAISTGSYRIMGYVKYGVFTEDFLRQLINQDIRFTTGVQQEAQLLARGERSLSLFMVEADAASLVKEGAPIKAIAMKEGVVALVMAIAQVKGGPHPNAATVFLNWLFSQEGQKVNAEAKLSASVRTDVANFTPEAARVQTKLLVLTPEMLNDQAKLFRDKYLVKLWGR